MTILHRQAMGSPDDRDAARAVHRGRLVANGLRGSMAMVALAVVVLAALAISR
jgi:hypothetical protein